MNKIPKVKLEKTKPENIIDAQTLKEPMTDNPWDLPFHVADFITPAVLKALGDYEVDQKEFMNAAGFKTLNGPEKTLALMVIICFMNMDALHEDEFIKAFDLVRSLVFDFSQKAKAANIVRDSMKTN